MMDMLGDMLDSYPLLTMAAGVFHFAFAIYFAIHAIRTRQDSYWLYILFIAPFMGSVVYFFAIYLPEIRYSRTGVAVARAAVRIVDPNRALREARRDFDRVPSIQHRIHLGEALLNAGGSENVKEARQYFEQAAQGAFATDPAVLAGLARVQFASGDAVSTTQTLSCLFKSSPVCRSQPLPTLLYDQALAAAQQPGVREAFEQAVIHGTDASARCLFAEWLEKQGDDTDRQRAREFFAEIEHDAKHWPKFAREHNKEWSKRAKAGTIRLAL
jgi:hypothetical protein